MAYEPVGPQAKGPHVSVEYDGGLNTQYDPGAYNNAPHVPQDSDTEYSVDNTKGVSQKWPSDLRKVGRITPLKALVLVFDVILASSPIMFLALALIAARLNGKEVSDYGTKLEQTLLLSPTIFPLIFAALMGRFFRHVGLFLAQRGTTLGRLEQLIGCQSVFSALERQFCLRSWSMLGLASVLIWLLSPVGGQSALRLIDQEIGNVQFNKQVRYLHPTTFMDSLMETANTLSSGRSSFTPIFLTSILSSTRYRTTPMDLWGNVKLPLYRTIENSTSDEWKFVPNGTADNVTYASLIGIPIAGPPSVGISSFNIEARQFDVTCSSNNASRGEPIDFVSKYTWQLQVVNDTAPPPCKKNGTSCAPPVCASYPCPIRSESLVDSDTGKYSVANCGLSFEKYEIGVRCNGTECAAYKMRKMYLYDEDYPIGYDIALRRQFMATALLAMTSADNFNMPSAEARGATTMEKWLQDPLDFTGVFFGNVELYKLSPQVFGDRLTIMYNTFWQSTYASRAIGGNLPASVMETGTMNFTQAQRADANITFVATEANVSQDTTPMYKTDWGWFAALLVCSIILLAAAYTGLVLKYITIAPDIIGYASSLTLLNPYVPTPTGGTTLTGLARTALMRDYPVRIGDVCPNEAVGAIAFARADRNVGKLDRKRFYI